VKRAKTAVKRTMPNIIAAAFISHPINPYTAPARKRVDASQRIFLKRYGFSVRLRFVGNQTFRGLKTNREGRTKDEARRIAAISSSCRSF
jgi:hypothetical protein